MTYVRAKKHLGQHFLKDENIARKIAESLTGHGDYKQVLEIGPGTGMLTKYLLEQKNYDTRVVEVDRESVEYLRQHYPQLKGKIFEGDFLRMDFDSFFQSAPQPEGPPGQPVRKPSPPWGGTKGGVIGNFPYNISSQIFFNVLEHRNQVPEVVCMIQKEVAQRIASKPGSKEYGILSVLLSAFYDIEYLFTVNETVFVPPPKVKSAVIRLKRNNTVALDCDEKQFFALVKAGFNQRRKTLRNALKNLTFAPGQEDGLFTKRAEQLSVQDFVELTKLVKK